MCWYNTLNDQLELVVSTNITTSRDTPFGSFTYDTLHTVQPLYSVDI